MTGPGLVDSDGTVDEWGVPRDDWVQNDRGLSGCSEGQRGPVTSDSGDGAAEVLLPKRRHSGSGGKGRKFINEFRERSREGHGKDFCGDGVVRRPRTR